MPDNKLSQPAAANIIFQVKHNFHPELEADNYHFNVVRGKMTQGINQYLSDLVAETVHAFDVEVGSDISEWRELRTWALVSKLVTRMTNKMLIGSPLCRNEEYLQLSCDITPTVFDTAVKIRNYPDFVKSIMMYFMKTKEQQLKIARKHLLPIIKERLTLLANPAAQEKDTKPVDTCKSSLIDIFWCSSVEIRSVQWLLDMSPPGKRNPEILMQRLLHLNVNAIHAPAYTVTECMVDLCRHPEIHEELRAEIEEVLGNKSGANTWTKENLDRLVKLDSFIRESSRLTPISASECYVYRGRRGLPGSSDSTKDII
jgi:Cytochrome P450